MYLYIQALSKKEFSELRNTIQNSPFFSSEFVTKKIQFDMEALKIQFNCTVEELKESFIYPRYTLYLKWDGFELGMKKCLEKLKHDQISEFSDEKQKLISSFIETHEHQKEKDRKAAIEIHSQAKKLNYKIKDCVFSLMPVDEENYPNKLNNSQIIIIGEEHDSQRALRLLETLVTKNNKNKLGKNQYFVTEGYSGENLDFIKQEIQIENAYIKMCSDAWEDLREEAVRELLEYFRVLYARVIGFDKILECLEEFKGEKIQDLWEKWRIRMITSEEFWLALKKKGINKKDFFQKLCHFYQNNNFPLGRTATAVAKNDKDNHGFISWREHNIYKEKTILPFLEKLKFNFIGGEHPGLYEYDPTREESKKRRLIDYDYLVAEKVGVILKQDPDAKIWILTGEAHSIGISERIAFMLGKQAYVIDGTKEERSSYILSFPSNLNYKNQMFFSSNPLREELQKEYDKFSDSNYSRKKSEKFSTIRSRSNKSCNIL